MLVTLQSKVVLIANNVHNGSFYANIITLRHSLSLSGSIVTSTPTPIGK